VCLYIRGKSPAQFISHYGAPISFVMYCVRKFLGVLLFCICAQVAEAAVVDANVFYFTDNITADENTSHAATLFNLLIGFDIDKKGMYQVGWSYASHTTETIDDASTVSYKSTQMGPGFVCYLDKSRGLRFGFAYLLKTLADYERTGGTAAEWRGTAMNADFGYQFRFDGMFSLGLRLNYSTTSYNESVVGTTKEDISHKKVIIYPSIAFTLDSF
jgi:hypothetical protein